MKITVTGGTGFLGRHTALRLKQLGHEVFILGRNDRVGQVMQEQGVGYRKVDLRDASGVEESCRGQDVIIHSGGLASPWGPYQPFYEANVVGTRNIIAGCRRHDVKKLVHISTPSLYFDYRHRRQIKESDPLPKKQASWYAITKGMADDEIEAATSSDFQSIAIRPRAIFGPGDTTVLGRVLRLAEKGSVPLINGGNSLVDLTYIDNVVDSLVLCLEAPAEKWGKTYNITNGEPITARRMMEHLFGALDRPVRYRNIPFGAAYAVASVAEVYYRLFRRGAEPPITRYGAGLLARDQTLDITRARQELHYQPRVSLDEGMKRFAVWWKGQQRDPSRDPYGIH